MSTLIDTNFLLAIALPKDVNHVKARAAMRELTTKRIIAAPVMPELFYLLTERISYARAIQAFELAQSGAFQIEVLTASDMQRMTEIMKEYHDLSFDYADAAIMALSERLNITEIYTFDRRDFSVFRPSHCEYLTLLP
jgi:uncharacterized protein